MGVVYHVLHCQGRGQRKIEEAVQLHGDSSGWQLML